MNNIKLASIFSLLSLLISAPIECANNAFNKSSDEQPAVKKRKLNNPYFFEEPKIYSSSASSTSTEAPFIQVEDKNTQQTSTTNTAITNTKKRRNTALLKKACNLRELLVKSDSEQQIALLLQQYKKTSTIIKILTLKQKSSSAAALELSVQQNSLPYTKALFKNAVFLLSKQKPLSRENKNCKTKNINSIRSALTEVQPTAQEPVASYLSKIINALNNEQTGALSLLSEELGNSPAPAPKALPLDPLDSKWRSGNTACKTAVLKKLISEGKKSDFDRYINNSRLVPNLVALLINKKNKKISVLETAVLKDLSYVKSALKQVFVLFANRKKEVDKEEILDLKEELAHVLPSATKNTAPFIQHAISALKKTNKNKLKDFLEKEFNQSSTQK